ncbi:MAG: sulfite exporter TauE/SafE family protein [Bacteriodetes bacterium]|nr:sulfite exporter TauE/SafE family protein [Bacteroidota bacterium]
MEYIAQVFIGITIGLSSGLFGIGGALVATPLLKLFAGLPALLALASPLPAAVPSAVSGSYAYYKNNLISFKIAGLTLLTAIPVNIGGSYLSHYVQSEYLMYATAAVMVYVAVTFLVRSWLLREEKETAPNTSVVMPLAIGALVGIFSGLLAVGGGIVMVPAFVRVMRLTLKQALATSLLCVAALSIPGTIVHGLLGHIDWQVALVLAVTSIPFSYIGAKAAVRLRNQTLERIYGVFMFVFAVYFILKM